MVENQEKNNLGYQNVSDDDEINLLDLFIVLLKHKKLIFSITFGVAVLSIIISLLMTPVYEAKTTLMPPQGAESSLSSAFAQTAAAAVGLGISAKNPSEIYENLLKSDFVVDRIIKQFNLMKLYKAKNIDSARKAVLKHLDVQIDAKTGIITVGYKDKNPVRSAQIANAFVAALRDLNNHLAITKASIDRKFFESELKKAYIKLVEAEKNVENFQKKTGVIELGEQTKASIASIANLKAQIAVQEAQIAAMGTYATPNNPAYQKAQATLSSLRSQLSALESNTNNSNNAITPLGKIPSLYGKYINVVGELGFRKTVYEMLLKLYEEASVKEAKGASLIQVIDKATPPQIRISPKRALIVIVSTFAAFFLSIFVAFFKEFIEKASQDEENKERMQLIKQYASLRKKKNQ
ncbi:MAG: GumC family protein [Desulfurella sp.]|uniref:GumC family protein n=1 Tax=Desulfurella sp. TaxID=1962857 RepID=UPI003D123418